MKIKNYIQNKKVKHFTVSGIEIFEKNTVTNNIDAKTVISKIVENLPEHLLKNIETIYIGSFDFLNDRQVQAAYENSSIFVTNEQDTEIDMIDDIVHEVAHSVEEIYSKEIYGDQKIESEFLQKRKRTWFSLKDQGSDLELQHFLNTDFSEDFDDYLYMEVGYPMLAMVTSNIFYSPYAITSLREYFANGFEAFFVKKDVERLKNISPSLYIKILNLLTLDSDR